MVVIESRTGGASFGPEGQGSPYRYALWRRLRVTGDKRVGFIMLNPSTATHQVDDPTIRRCLGYARLWGFDIVEVGNLFALRTTDPRPLYTKEDPVGPLNNESLQQIAECCQFVVLGWGAHGGLHKRGEAVRELLAPYDCRVLAWTKRGQPAHPLYLSGDLEPKPLPPDKPTVEQVHGTGCFCAMCR